MFHKSVVQGFLGCRRGDNLAKKFVLISLVLILGFSTLLVASVPLPAGNLSPQELSKLVEQPFPGSVFGEGNYFTITETDYLQISLTSSENVQVFLESIPKMVSFGIQGKNGATLTTLTLSGFEPNRTYYRYQDGEFNSEFTTDASGNYTYTQDISNPHHTYILEQKSNTIYIRPDGAIEGCPSWYFSVWGNVYTMRNDIYDNIIIEKDNIIIDGSSYRVINPGGKYYGFYLSGRNNVTIKNTVVEGFNQTGIYLYNSPGCNINGDTVKNNGYIGINLWLSPNAVLDSNIVQLNGVEGIYLGNSPNSTLNANKVTGGWGIHITYNSAGCSLTNNDVSFAGFGIIVGAGSDKSNIVSNKVYNNVYGLYLASNENIITKNNISNNSGYGITYDAGSNNRIYHNNFINNMHQVYSIGTINVWDDGWLSGGNYWSDYQGVDNLSGASQDQPGNDGLGDTAYVIDTNNKDSYPFMELSGWEKTRDVYPPTTSITLNGTLGNDGWYTSDVTVSLTATDDLSGVARTEYSFDNTNWLTYTSPFTVTTEGTNTIYYKSIDSTGKIEQVKSQIVKIDETLPTTTISLSGTLGEGGWYISDVTVTLTASDNVSGVAKTEYSLDNVTWTVYTSPLTISKEGATVVNYRSIDNAGKTEEVKSQTVKIDKTPPITTITLSGILGTDGWYTSDVIVTLTASDNVSGITKTEYSFDNVNWVVYTTPLSISEQGTTTVYYKSFDNVGNTEQVKSQTFKIDKTPPITTINLNGTLGNDGWYTSDVTVTLSASDDLSGVAKTEYSLDNVTWTVYTTPLTISNEGTTIVYYKSINNAGNTEQVKSQTIKIDKMPPTTKINLTGSLAPDGWYISGVVVTLTAIDNFSGVAKTEYSFDNTNWLTYSDTFKITSEGVVNIYYRSIDRVDNVEESSSIEIEIKKCSRTLTVPVDYPKIQAAIGAAQPGDTVLVAPGDYTESIRLKLGVTVQGSGADVTTIRGDGSWYQYSLQTYTVLGANDSTISEFTIAGSRIGIFNRYSSPRITNNIIADNLWDIANEYFSSPMITNNTITRSKQSISNGYNSSPTIKNNMFTDSEYGIYNYGDSSPTIVNNVITRMGDCAIYNPSSCNPAITNNTITANWHGILNYGSSPTITNNVITDNTNFGIFNRGSSPMITYNDLRDNRIDIYNEYFSYPLIANNISADPMFIDPANGDYRLTYMHLVRISEGQRMQLFSGGIHFEHCQV